MIKWIGMQSFALVHLVVLHGSCTVPRELLTVPSAYAVSLCRPLAKCALLLQTIPGCWLQMPKEGPSQVCHST